MSDQERGSCLEMSLISEAPHYKVILEDSSGAEYEFARIANVLLKTDEEREEFYKFVQNCFLKNQIEANGASYNVIDLMIEDSPEQKKEPENASK